MKKIIYVFVLLLSIIYSSNIYSQCVTGDCINGEGTYLYSNAKYWGKWKDGKAEGTGVLYFNDGSTMYQGNFSNDKKNGFGIQAWSDGNRYEGNWIDDNRTGQGTFYWKDGDKYVGQFLNGQTTENGVTTRKAIPKLCISGDCYNGYGKFGFTNAVYEGYFKNGKREGKGKTIAWDGGIYEGDYVDGLPNGKGKYTFSDGSVYDGDWVDGNKTGKGKYVWGKGKWEGEYYEGDWVDFSRTGYGKYTKKDGTIQEGRFLNNVFQGSEVASSNTKVNSQSSTTPISSLTDDDIVWKHSKGSFEIKGKEGDQKIWQEDGGRFIYLEQEWQTDGTKEGSGPILKRKNENVYIKLTFNNCYYKDNSNPNWALLYNGGFYSKTLARYLVIDDFNKSSQSTSTSTSTSNVSANKTVSNYKFTPPPALKITYTDNRKMCCCCNEKYAQYELQDKKKLEVTEKIYYCTEKLALFHKENGNGPRSSTINPEQIELDLKKLQDELLKLYPNDGLEIGFGSTMWYKVAAMGFMKLCSTERNVDLYRNIGNHCSLKCKNICGSCR
jgi:hypothetical protein